MKAHAEVTQVTEIGGHRVDHAKRLQEAIHSQLLAGRVLVVQQRTFNEWDFLAFASADEQDWREVSYLGRYRVDVAAAGVGQLELHCGRALYPKQCGPRFMVSIYRVIPVEWKPTNWDVLNGRFRVYNFPLQSSDDE